MADDWTRAMRRTRNLLMFGESIARCHQILTAEGWSSVEAHFLIRAAQVSPNQVW